MRWPAGSALALAGAVVALSLGGFAGPVSAEAPTVQGWWQSLNPGGLPADPPAPPDVAPDGLLVQAGPSGPSAYAALSYDLAAGATPSTLTLELASAAPPAAAPSLVLCALKAPSFSQEQGGPMSDAPPYDCKRTASGQLDGSRFTFDVGPLVHDGVLAVAVLPGDATTRASLVKPGEASLAVAGGPMTAPVTALPGVSAPGAGAAPAPPDASNVVAVPPPAPGTDPVPPTQVAAGPSVARAPAVAQAGAPTSVSTRPLAASTSTGSARRVLVVLLVAALACYGVTWAFADGGPAGPEPVG